MFNKYAQIVNNYNLLKAARFMYRVKSAANFVPRPRVPRIRRMHRRDPLASTGTAEGINRITDTWGYGQSALAGGGKYSPEYLKRLGYDPVTIAQMLGGHGATRPGYATIDNIVQQRMAAGARSGLY